MSPGDSDADSDSDATFLYWESRPLNTIEHSSYRETTSVLMIRALVQNGEE